MVKMAEQLIAIYSDQIEKKNKELIAMNGNINDASEEFNRQFGSLGITPFITKAQATRYN